MKLFSIGTNLKDGENYFLNLEKNSVDSLSKNFFMIGTMGTGKSNTLQLFGYMLYKAYKETNGNYGCIPIFFVPTFEYLKTNYPSRNKNLLPDVYPDSLNAIHITFPCCEPILHKDLISVTFNFNSLSYEDIGAFAGLSVHNKLGFIQKTIEKFEKGYYKKIRGESVFILPNPNYTVSDFLEAMKEENHITKDELYYVFSKLKNMGVFDEGKRFDMKSLIRQKRPVIFHFGDLNDKNLISAFAGIILRKLWDIAKDFYDAELKKEGGMPLSEWEEFLLENWCIGLFMEEAHQILYATKSSGLAMESRHPAHVWFKKISSQMGRKKMFKYNFIVTQKFLDIYYGIRKSFNYLILGSTIYPDDKDFLIKELRFNVHHLNKMIILPKFSWCIVNIDEYQKRQKRFAVKFRCWLSPCGQT